MKFRDYVLFSERPNSPQIGPSSVDCRERESYALGVYHTQGTTHIRTANIKQEEEAHTRIMARE